MKANELRIGNLVEYGNDIEQITIHHLFGVMHGDDVKPIPLTEEWLFKFWFRYNDGLFIKENLVVFIYDGYCKVVFGSLTFVDGVKIKHVHQLQNLYFALTGEELTLKQDENGR
jgi:hypothetical protein